MSDHDTCKLDATQGVHSFCREEQCSFWRVVEHLDIGAPRTGCAIQYFQLLDGGDDVASWLLSVRDRLEGEGGALDSATA